MSSPSLLPPARLYLCGFPKAGLHLADLWVSTLLEPEGDHEHGHWFGTFDGNAWTTAQSNLEHIELALAAVRTGHYIKGHMGWSPALAGLARHLRMGIAFVYRDLRDVVVSQAYHVLSDDDLKLKHPGKALYKVLPTFEDVMIACIEGIGPYAGLFERWELYAGWLLEPGVLALRFEEMVSSGPEVAKRLIRYCYRQAWMDCPAALVNKLAPRVVQNGRCTRRSPTFRRGKPGAWRKHFTENVRAVFKARDPGWLVKLGYERDNEW